ncbi:unnamed protein product [Lampetra planeri]
MAQTATGAEMGGPANCVAEFKSAVMDFKKELKRLQANLAVFTEYQESMLHINKIMVSAVPSQAGSPDDSLPHPNQDKPGDISCF